LVSNEYLPVVLLEDLPDEEDEDDDDDDLDEDLSGPLDFWPNLERQQAPMMAS